MDEQELEQLMLVTESFTTTRAQTEEGAIGMVVNAQGDEENVDFDSLVDVRFERSGRGKKRLDFHNHHGERILSIGAEESGNQEEMVEVLRNSTLCRSRRSGMIGVNNRTRREEEHVFLVKTSLKMPDEEVVEVAVQLGVTPVGRVGFLRKDDRLVLARNDAAEMSRIIKCKLSKGVEGFQREAMAASKLAARRYRWKQPVGQELQDAGVVIQRERVWDEVPQAAPQEPAREEDMIAPVAMTANADVQDDPEELLAFIDANIMVAQHEQEEEGGLVALQLFRAGSVDHLVEVPWVNPEANLAERKRVRVALCGEDSACDEEVRGGRLPSQTKQTEQNNKRTNTKVKTKQEGFL